MFEKRTSDKEAFLIMAVNQDVGDIVVYTTEMFKLAIELNASDIHVEPLRDFITIRFRESGDFIYIDKISKDEYAKLLARLKIMANMRIDEKHRPQDGKIAFTMPVTQEIIDIRVSLLPIVDGEKVVMRLLRQDMSLLNLDKLNFLHLNLEKIRNTLKSKF